MIWIILIIWILLGFVAFLKEMRDEKQVDFNEDTRDQFFITIVGGVFSFIIIFIPVFIEWMMRLVQKKEN